MFSFSVQTNIIRQWIYLYIIIDTYWLLSSAPSLAVSLLGKVTGRDFCNLIRIYSRQ